MLPVGYRALENGSIIGKYGRPLKLRASTNGYLHFTASNGAAGKTDIAVHVMVCETFHGPKPFPEAQVRHLNGVKTDNRAKNLCWGTSAENYADRDRHGVMPRGESHRKSKLTAPQVLKIRSRHAQGEKQNALAREYGVTPQTINYVVHRATWAHL